MSATVLSTLCSICHAQPPKYKCPRCGARTCSVPCIQKHKARADCDGVRNPRAFMPLSQLKTEAGIDHDFNFLTSIERARERAEKDIIEARRLLSEKDLRPPNEDKLYEKVWHGDKLHHIPVRPLAHTKHGGPKGRHLLDDSGSFDKHVRRRLRHSNIEALMMPKGMVRQRENKTSFNRRTHTINWQVEWLVYGALQLDLPGLQTDQQQQQPLRVLYKTLEGTPLNTALATTLEWHRGQFDRQAREQHNDPHGSDNNELDDSAPRKKRKTHHHHHHHHKRNENKPALPPPTVQDPTTCTWPSAPYPFQYPLTSAWSQTSNTLPSVPSTLEEQLSRSWRFYLLKAGRPTPTPKTLIPLAATESLTSALAGRTVLEFPTVVVMPSNIGAVPDGYVIGDPAERRRKPTAEDQADEEGRAREYATGGRGDDRRNSTKRAFEEGGSRNRNGNGYGRGGKRIRFEQHRPPRVREAVVEEPEVEDEIEEGEVHSDEDEAMAEPDGRVSVGLADVDGESNSESEDESETDSGAMIGEGNEEGEKGEKGEIRATKNVKVQTGLVDYGSSDDSD